MSMDNLDASRGTVRRATLWWTSSLSIINFPPMITYEEPTVDSRISTCFYQCPISHRLCPWPLDSSFSRPPCRLTCCVRLFAEPPCLQGHSQRLNLSDLLSATTRPLRPLLPSLIYLLSQAWVLLYLQPVVTMCTPPTLLRVLRAP